MHFAGAGFENPGGFGGDGIPAAMEEVMGEGLFQPLHILLIVGIALLLFGPSKFADLGKGLGEGIRNFKAAVKEEPKKDEEKKS
ncbi:MAG TPA: twin-arginine translocase TatA/TatE family subunit [Terriglobales bacterium]|nr:twin-arginine translocase TatA/TatE family subunit [Terriglobales bacterium]